MKKLMLVLIVVVAIALLALPPVAGSVAKEQISAGLTDASDNGFISFSISDYEKNWFTSTGLIEVRLTEEYQQLLEELATDEADAGITDENFSQILDQTIMLDLELNHGPVTLDGQSFVGWSAAIITLNSEDEELAALINQLDIPYLVQVKTRTGFDGATSFTAEVPAFSYLDELTEITFSGFAMDGSYSDGHLVTSGNAERFELDSLTANLVMNDLRVSGDQQNYAAYLWLGTTDISVASIATRSELEPELGRFEIADLRINSNVALSEKPDHVDMELSYKLGAMTAQDLDLSAVDVRLLLKQIDIASLDLYYQLNSDLALIDQQAMNDRRPEMEAALYKALSGSPSIALQPLSFRLNEEAFDASLVVGVLGEKLPLQDNWDIYDTAAWPAILTLEAETLIAKGLALQVATQTLEQQIMTTSTAENPIDPIDAKRMAEQQAPAMLDVLVLQGMLTKTDEGFAGTASYKDNALTVNGMPIPLGGEM